MGLSYNDVMKGISILMFDKRIHSICIPFYVSIITIVFPNNISVSFVKFESWMRDSIIRRAYLT